MSIEVPSNHIHSSNHHAWPPPSLCNSNSCISMFPCQLYTTKIHFWRSTPLSKASGITVALFQYKLYIFKQNESHYLIITSKNTVRNLHTVTYASKSFRQYFIFRYYSYSLFFFFSRFTPLIIPGPYRASAVVIYGSPKASRCRSANFHNFLYRS